MEFRIRANGRAGDLEEEEGQGTVPLPHHKDIEMELQSPLWYSRSQGSSDCSVAVWKMLLPEVPDIRDPAIPGSIHWQSRTQPSYYDPNKNKIPIAVPNIWNRGFPDGYRWQNEVRPSFYDSNHNKNVTDGDYSNNTTRNSIGSEPVVIDAQSSTLHHTSSEIADENPGSPKDSVKSAINSERERIRRRKHFSKNIREEELPGEASSSIGNEGSRGIQQVQGHESQGRASNSQSGSSTNSQQQSEHECDKKRSVFVKNLPKIGNLEEELVDLFQNAGFFAMKVSLPKNVKRFRDFAFVEFIRSEVADEAILVMNEVEFHGKKILVMKANTSNTQSGSSTNSQQQSEHESDKKRLVFVKNLPKIGNLKEELVDLFQNAGFFAMKVSLPKNVKRFRDFAYVEFIRSEVADEVILVMNEVEFHGKKLLVMKPNRNGTPT